MSKVMLPERLQTELESFLKRNRRADLVTTYLFYLEKKFNLDPVVFIPEKKIYQSEAELIKSLEENGKLWRETEIQIQVGQAAVNELTKRIYICPFSGKVFGDNTHPNPQDAIYDWVSKCPENTERKDGLRVKKFYVSEDPEVIKNYIKKRKEPLKKIVYTSMITGKLYNSKQSVVEDMKKNHLRHIPMKDVTVQNRFEIQSDFLAFIQEHLEESKISSFVEKLSDHEFFAKHVARWMEEGEEEDEGEE